VISERVGGTRLVLLPRTITSMVHGRNSPSWRLLDIGDSLQRRPASTSSLVGNLAMARRRAPVGVGEVRALRHGDGDSLLVEPLPEADDLLLEPDDLLLQDRDLGEELQRLRRQVRWKARESAEWPREGALQSSVDVLLVPQLLPQLVHLQPNKKAKRSNMLLTDCVLADQFDQKLNF
jgi:hypothetical protein